MGSKLNPNSDAWGGSWGATWAGSWGWSWGPLHEVEERPFQPGGKGPWWNKLPLSRDADEALIRQVVDKWDAIAEAKSKPQRNDAGTHTETAEVRARRAAVADANRDAELMEAAAMFLMMIDD